MSTVGVIVNPHARRNRGRSAEVVEGLQRVVGDAGWVHVCSDSESLHEAMVALKGAGASVLAICGGDGTNGVVVGAAETVFGPDAIPKIALLRGGTMNTTAKGLGVARGRPLALLEALVRSLREGHEIVTVTRPMLRGGGRLGHIFGTGVMVRYLEEYYGRSRPHPTPWTAFTTLARVAGSAAVGGSLSRQLAALECLELEIDGERLAATELLTVTAGTVPEVGLGFAPYHRCAEEAGRFHVLGITVGAGGFLRDLVRMRTGRGLAPGHGFSRLAERVILRPADGGDTLGVMFDGDVSRAAAPFELSLGPVIDVVVGTGVRGS